MAEKKSAIKQFVDGEVKNAPRAVLEDLFEDYYNHRHQLYVMNFIRGIFFGFGGVIGGTIVVALLLWLLSVLHHIPFIDGIIDAARQSLQEH